LALNFTPSSQKIDLQKDNDIVESAVVESTVVEEPQYSIVEVKEQLKQELVNADAVNKLVAEININDTNSIVQFGANAANEISQASDSVLKSMSMNDVSESTRLLDALAKLMQQFDIKEVTEEKKGFFVSLKKQIDKILEKYTSMGSEVDKIYVELRKYEAELEKSNTQLQSLYETNIDYYKDLLLYIAAGEQACIELDGYIEEYRQKVAANPDSGTTAMDLQTLEQTRGILEQRVMDLKIAENVAMQSVPMLKMMQFSNVNLTRKINSAFIITLPIFKQALAQAVMLKRQRVIAEGMSALDKTTNELLLKNAQNTVMQSKMIAQMANGNSIQVETLEKSWQTIVSGIQETKEIQDSARKRRLEDSKRLEQLKRDYRLKMG